MRTTLAYSSARILLLVVSMILLYLVGARGLLLLALAFVVSGIASFVLLSKQRDIMSGALTGRLRNRRQRVSGFRSRLDEGARAEEGVTAAKTLVDSGRYGEASQRVSEVLARRPDYSPALDLAHQIEQARSLGILSEDEATLLADYDRKVMQIINVDDFDPDELGTHPA